MDKQTREVLLVMVLCFLWYFTSSSNNVIRKLLLNNFPYPMTVTMMELVSIVVYSKPLFKIWKVRKFYDISRKYFWKLIIPLAFGKFFATTFSHLSIWKVPVSYLHTVKATMPLFTVLLLRLIMKEKQTTKVYLSLIPIITGVAIATLTELSFDIIGLLAALLSTLVFSLQSIFSKKVLKDTGIHHLILLELLGQLALIIFTPLWLYVDFLNVIKEPALISGNYSVLLYLFLDGALNWLQNVLAFSLISLVSPLTYSVAGASKRIFVIGSSLFLLGNPVTSMNIFGMLLAIFGILAYNKAKYDQRNEGKLETLLPYSNKKPNSEKNGFINNNLNGYQTNALLNGAMYRINSNQNLYFPTQNSNMSNGGVYRG